jgi:predicted nucleic acid-binding protein
MSGALLDTSVLIANAGAASVLPPTAAISVVTLGELHAGVHMARSDTVRDLRSRRLEAVRGAFAPLPVDEPVAERYGGLLALARSRRRSEKATDLLILATASAGGRTLYTLDRRQAELARAAGIEVVAV